MQLPAFNWPSLTRSAATILAACLLSAAPALADGDTSNRYTLGVSDKLSVRVVEWQSAGATFQDWTAVTGSYLVGPGGTVSFPFVGDVEAAGKTTAELSQALSAGLRTTLGLTDPPNVTVEVETFGPVYVTGDVQSSGAYPYAPGLNVIKAISLAGGLRHSSADAAPDANRQLIDLQGTYNVLKDQRVRLLVQRARLDAVLAKQNALTIPPQIKDDAEAPALAQSETTILNAGLDQIKSQSMALDAQKQLLNKSIDALAQKRDTAAQQLALAQDRLQKVQTLATNGLAITDRVMTLQSNVADLEGQLLDIDTADLKAKQDVTVADTQNAKLTSDALLQAAQDRQDVDAQLAQTELKLATQQQLIQSAIANGATPADPGAATYTYTILRDGKEVPASKVDALRPGDVVTAAIAMNP